MKLGIIGTGNVGNAIALAAATRGSAREIVLANRTRKVAEAAAVAPANHEASQYGIGIASARIAEMVLRDERSVIPIGSYQREFGVTLSLPSAVGRGGVTMTLPPDPSAEEKSGLERSAENLRTALKRVTS